MLNAGWNAEPLRTIPNVTASALAQLLHVGCETPYLDFKLSWDLSNRDAVVEFARDVGAFCDEGGWIVVGADDAGVVPTQSAAHVPCGVPKGQGDLWDEARLRSKLARYIPGNLSIATALHEVGGVLLALVQVLPHPDGCCVFKTIGQKGNNVIFKEGDIFVRRGTSSVKADQADIARIIQKKSLLALDAERAARAARAAARSAASCLDSHAPQDAAVVPDRRRRWRRQRATQAERPRLEGAVGFAAAGNQADLGRRVFFDQEYRGELERRMEFKTLRRDGHSFQPRRDWEDSAYTVSGSISFAGEETSRVAVRTDAAGAVGVSFCEDVDQWQLDELVAWWIQGAWQVALNAERSLGSAGNLYVSHFVTLKNRQIEANVGPLVVDWNAMSLDPASVDDVAWRFMDTVREAIRLEIEGGPAWSFASQRTASQVDLREVRSSLGAGRQPGRRRF